MILCNDIDLIPLPFRYRDMLFDTECVGIKNWLADISSF